jgi:TonB family protein
MLNWTATLWPLAASLAIKSALVLIIACLAAFVMRRASAAARHIVWTACAAALLSLPLLSISVPALRLSAANAILPTDTGLVFRSTATDSAQPATPATQHASRASTPAATPARPINPRTAILSLWAAGAILCLIQMLYACFALRRLRRTAVWSPDADDAAALAQAIGIDTPVRVLETPHAMPMTFGIRRPVILMPAAAADWTESRRRIVLLHELAHVLRGDAATHLIARTALSLYWWNPLAWTAWREFLKERERAADDLVLAAGARQSDYAGHLLEIARAMQSAPTPAAAAAIAMARPSQLEGRLLAILSDKVNRRNHGRAAVLIGAVLAIAIVLPIAAIRAQSIPTPATPPDVDATIRAAMSQKNHQLLEPAADLYENLHKYQEALALREASLTIREQESGKDSAQYAEGLVLLGDLLAKRGGNAQEVADYYTQAIQSGDRPEVYPALFRLGMRAYHEQNPALAFDYLRRASNVARNGNEAGSATTWMANVQSGLDAGLAESLYRSAMTLEEFDSPEQAITLDFFARFLKQQARDSEAEPLSARASDLHKARVLAISPKSVTAAPASRVGGGIGAPKLLTKSEPQYTDDARSAKITGTVTLYVVIDTDGRAKDARVLKGVGYGLDEKAVEAVAKWTFQPGIRAGDPVRVEAQIEINFRLL